MIIDAICPIGYSESKGDLTVKIKLDQQENITGIICPFFNVSSKLCTKEGCEHVQKAGAQCHMLNWKI